ncbi:hypothetical protein I5Q34_33995 [Streptomyces sp. AV19]|uniref:hypothetical protein n=1 Tax=Streptomyces sp. AV19 TaxID=2793068 RepID=UPI0018FEEB49|nr:hypothetical protein [Streptomyces sp. AV19]MBH1939213.1 hypothetical protein [Streptomyces sp. AV19]MDG4537205.1 hypothetical protein [Streptomyces sp. AV19]
MNFVLHPVPLWHLIAASALLLVAAIALPYAVSRRASVRPVSAPARSRRKLSAGTLSAMAAFVVCTSVSLNTSYRFTSDGLDMTGDVERMLSCAAFECLIAMCVLGAREKLAAERTTGWYGSAVWILAVLSAVPAWHEGGGLTAGTIVRIIVGSFGSAISSHAALGLELRHREGAESQSAMAQVIRDLRERLMARLGLTTRSRTAQEIAQDRALSRALDLAVRYQSLTEKSRPKKRVRLDARQARALIEAGCATDPRRRDEYRRQLALLQSPAELRAMAITSPWQEAGTPEEVRQEAAAVREAAERVRQQAEEDAAAVREAVRLAQEEARAEAAAVRERAGQVLAEAERVRDEADAEAAAVRERAGQILAEAERVREAAEEAAVETGRAADEADSARDAAERVRDALRAEVAELEDRAECVRQSATASADEVAAAEGDVERMREELADAAEEVRRRRAEAQDAQSKARQAQQEQADAVDAVRAAQDKVSRLTDEAERLRQEIEVDQDRQRRAAAAAERVQAERDRAAEEAVKAAEAAEEARREARAADEARRIALLALQQAQDEVLDVLTNPDPQQPPQWRSEAKRSGWDLYYRLARTEGREPTDEELAMAGRRDTSTARHWIRDFRKELARFTADALPAQATAQNHTEGGTDDTTRTSTTAALFDAGADGAQTRTELRELAAA